MRKDITTDELRGLYIEPYLEYISYELDRISKLQGENFSRNRNVSAPPTDLEPILTDLHGQSRIVGRTARQAMQFTQEESAKMADLNMRRNEIFGRKTNPEYTVQRANAVTWQDPDYLTAKFSSPFANSKLNFLNNKLAAVETDIQKIKSAREQRAISAEKYAQRDFNRRNIEPLLTNADRFEKYKALRDSYTQQVEELKKAHAGFQNFVAGGATAAERIGITYYSVEDSVPPPKPLPTLSTMQLILGHDKNEAHAIAQRLSLAAFLESGGAIRVSVSDPPVIHSIKGNRPYNLHDEFSSLLNRLACQVDVHQDLYSKLQANAVVIPDKTVLDEKIKAMEIQRKKELIDAKRENRITADYQMKLENLRERAQTGNSFQRFVAVCELKYQELQKHPTATLVDTILLNATDEVCTDESYQKAHAKLIGDYRTHEERFNSWAMDVKETEANKRRVAAVRDAVSNLIRDTNALFHYGVEFPCVPSNVSDEDLVSHAQALLREFAPSITSEREDLNLYLHTDRPLDRTLRLSVP